MIGKRDAIPIAPIVLFTIFLAFVFIFCVRNFNPYSRHLRSCVKVEKVRKKDGSRIEGAVIGHILLGGAVGALIGAALDSPEDTEETRCTEYKTYENYKWKEWESNYRRRNENKE